MPQFLETPSPHSSRASMATTWTCKVATNESGVPKNSKNYLSRSPVIAPRSSGLYKILRMDSPKVESHLTKRKARVGKIFFGSESDHSSSSRLQKKTRQWQLLLFDEMSNCVRNWSLAGSCYTMELEHVVCSIIVSLANSHVRSIGLYAKSQSCGSEASDIVL